MLREIKNTNTNEPFLIKIKKYSKTTIVSYQRR
jgi:hypothetical protein